MSGALADLRVIELAADVAGAFCGKLLADLGACVLKVEPPGGDPLRAYGPFPGDVAHPDRSGLFLCLNENKLGANLDTSRSEDLLELERLCSAADVVIASSATQIVGTLDLPALQRKSPRVIVVSITPFGRTGPYRDYLAGELQIVHASGLGWETPFNQVEDPEHEPPLKPFGHQALMVTGWTAALAALAAIHQRSRIGSGDWVELSAFEAVTNMIRPNYAFASHEPEDGSNRSRLTQRRVWGLPWIYRCADGYLSIAVIADSHWKAIREMMGNPEWAESELFDSPRGRYQNSDALRPALADWISRQSAARLYREGQARHIPVFPLQGIAELLDDPQLEARQFFRRPDSGAMVFPGYPYKWSATPCRSHRPAPRLGADDRQEFFAAQAPSRPDEAPAGGSASLPLSGVRVLDFGWVVAVPFATAWLGALGADVVRVESMARPDPARFLAVPPGSPPGVDSSPYFNNLNLSKRSIRLNLAHPEGRRLVRRLVPHLDVVAENFTVGHMEAWGLGYEDLSRLKRDLIFVSASPLGQTGPESRCVGWGPNTQAYAGLCAVTGYEGGPPCGVGGTWPDFAAAVALAFAVLAALHHRRRTGQGQRIDLALAELVVSMLPEAFCEFSLAGREPRRRGNRDLCFAPHNAYRCRGEDSWIAISVENDREWRALAAAIGRPDWGTDARFAAAAARRQQEDEIDREIQRRTRDRDAAALAGELQRAGVRAVKVLNTEELLCDPHFLARELLVTVNHPVSGARPILGLPGRFGGFRYGYRPAPRMGADSEAVLGELLGIGREEVCRLEEEKIIF